MKRLKHALAASAALAMAATGTLSVAAQDKEELKIGVIAALSGGGTAWGQGLLRGVETAVDELNESGGLTVDGTTYELTVIPFDDQYNAAQAKTAVERLVHNEGVRILFGPVGSPGALASVPVTQPAKVLQFVDGYAPKILDNEWKEDSYIFRVGLSSGEFSDPVVEWVAKTMPDVKKVGLIAPNDAVGQQAITALVDRYGSQGFEVWTDFYERGSKEFTPLLLRMVSEDVDLFDLNSNAPGEAALLLRQAREIGYTGRVLQAGGAGVAEIVEAVGPHAEGFLKYDVVDLDDPALEDFTTLYREKHPDGPINGLAPEYYSMAQTLFEAIRRVDSLDTTKIRDELESMEGYETPLGPLKWTGKEKYGVDHQIVIPFYIMKVEDGVGEVEAKIVPDLD